MHGHYAFPQLFTVGGVSWTSDPSMEAVNCKIKLANNFILANILACNIFKWNINGAIIESGPIIDVEIWIIETYDTLLKSHLAVQICTVSYVEYSLNS